MKCKLSRKKLRKNTPNFYLPLHDSLKIKIIPIESMKKRFKSCCVLLHNCSYVLHNSSCFSQRNISVLASDGPYSEWWGHVHLVTDRACETRLEIQFWYVHMFSYVHLENTVRVLSFRLSRVAFLSGLVHGHLQLVKEKREGV